MSFEPFDLNPELLWLCSVGIACLCACSTAQILEKTDLKALVLGLSIVLFGGKKCLARESVDKIRDVLSSVLGSAVKYGYLVTNPAEALQLPPSERGHEDSSRLSGPSSFLRWSN